MYEVYTTFEVTPDHIEILNDSGIKHELTLYTCTPIYTSDRRLVVKAKLIG
ncbi:MAG: sortase domain-bontaining protein [Candidatus Dojkabacteria bacterium]